jgi:hypothetical protein
MPRPARILPLVALLAAIGACGSDTVVSQADVDRRLEGVGSPAPELIYVTEAAGYAVARQSVGVYGNDGFGAHYSSPQGGTFRLVVDRGGSECAQPSVGTAGAAVTCEEDGGLLYRSTPDSHEYARAEQGHVVRVGSTKLGVDRETLRRAAAAAHRAEGSELDDLLPPLTDLPGAPVRRGDLPANGDGAPLNPTAPGG